MDVGFRSLPSVDRVVSHEGLSALREIYPQETLVQWARQEIEDARRAIAEGKPSPGLEGILASLLERAQTLARPSLRPVINASGVILHTNLGRAPLSQEAIRAMELVARGYTNLEFNLESGERGSRYSHLERILCQLTGAEASLVVNNNASAVLLGLSTLARGREVIISRGQAVEIGGGFRIPDVMRQSGARLVEVGTTNRTYLADYEAAITPRTAALMRVHASNFKVVGFTHSVTLAEMAELARRHNILLLDDLGSGCLLDTREFGLAHEPTVQESVTLGAALTFFSADKLLGGPQGGIIVGEKDLVEKLKRHPLARAVRIDKLSLAALSATLLHYLRGEAKEKLPVWRIIAMPLDQVEARAQRWAGHFSGLAGVVEGESAVGGGSLPGETLPTRLMSIKAPRGGPSLPELARRLRQGEPPIIGRIERNRLLLDPRCVLPEEDEQLLESLQRALTG